MPRPRPRLTTARVRADFNDIRAVVHYARAAHQLGLWSSERLLIERFFPDHHATLLEAGCGAGRVFLALHDLGYRRLAAFDFAEEQLAIAHSLLLEREASHPLFHADATRLTRSPAYHDAVARLHRPPPAAFPGFDGALFLFNGLMQIPGRTQRRRALRQLAAACRPGAHLLFTTHDRDHSPAERASWRLEAKRWSAGKQDPLLREFGDRYFEDDIGRTFMHLPDRTEILQDLQATGWQHHFDAMRSQLGPESRAVRDFSDECRFWAATKKA